MAARDPCAYGCPRAVQFQIGNLRTVHIVCVERQTPLDGYDQPRMALCAAMPQLYHTDFGSTFNPDSQESTQPIELSQPSAEEYQHYVAESSIEDDTDLDRIFEAISDDDYNAPSGAAANTLPGVPSSSSGVHRHSQADLQVNLTERGRVDRLHREASARARASSFASVLQLRFSAAADLHAQLPTLEDQPAASTASRAAEPVPTPEPPVEPAPVPEPVIPDAVEPAPVPEPPVPDAVEPAPVPETPVPDAAEPVTVPETPDEAALARAFINERVRINIIHGMAASSRLRRFSTPEDIAEIARLASVEDVDDRPLVALQATPDISAEIEMLAAVFRCPSEDPDIEDLMRILS